MAEEKAMGGKSGENEMKEFGQVNCKIVLQKTDPERKKGKICKMKA